MSKFNPGAVVTAAALEVGDIVFLRERRNAPGLPVPHTPVEVTDLVPFADGRVQVTVKAANAGSPVEPRILGQLPASREFRRAVAEV